MTDSWSSFLRESLTRVHQQRTNRRRRLPSTADSECVDFGSNDYLGLRSHPCVLQALRDHSQLAWGAGASSVLSGYTSLHRQLEESLARLAQSAEALVFASGFACNVGTVACLASAGDLILSDQWNHASLIDGCRLSRAEKFIYRHGDVQQLFDYLRGHRHRFNKVLLLTESIFSMDGDAAPLAELADLASEFDCGLVVDEAHAVGIYGPNGGGLLEELHLQDRTFAKLGTLSKALGGVGGYVCGSQELIEYLVNHCRSYLFSTAPPAASVAAAKAAVDQLQFLQAERQRLKQLSQDMRDQLRAAGMQVREGDSPIVPVIVGAEEAALRMAERLLQHQLYVPAIRPPTVPPGTSRLRISLSLRHTPQQVARLIQTLSDCANSL